MRQTAIFDEDDSFLALPRFGDVADPRWFRYESKPAAALTLPALEDGSCRTTVLDQWYPSADSIDSHDPYEFSAFRQFGERNGCDFRDRRRCPEHRQDYGIDDRCLSHESPHRRPNNQAYRSAKHDLRTA
jgi:hypothetical protein